MRVVGDMTLKREAIWDDRGNISLGSWQAGEIGLSTPWFVDNDEMLTQVCAALEKAIADSDDGDFFPEDTVKEHCFDTLEDDFITETYLENALQLKYEIDTTEVTWGASIEGTLTIERKIEMDDDGRPIEKDWEIIASDFNVFVEYD